MPIFGKWRERERERRPAKEEILSVCYPEARLSLVRGGEERIREMALSSFMYLSALLAAIFPLKIFENQLLNKKITVLKFRHLHFGGEWAPG